MMSSRSQSMRMAGLRSCRAFACLLLAWALGFVFVSNAVGPAYADMASMSESSSESTADGEGVASLAQVDNGEQLEQLGLMPKLFRLTGYSQGEVEGGLPLEGVGALFPNLLDIVVTPASLSTGIECRMNEFCGYDPCTCGKPDAWGHCACGGFKTTVPTVNISVSDPSVAMVVQAFGRVWLVPLSSGVTQVSITADLVHYQSASYVFNVQVMPFSAIDALLVIVFALVVVALFAALFFLVRFIVRRIRAANERRRMWRQRGNQLKEEFPLTWQAKLQTEKNAASRKRSRRSAHRIRPFTHDVLFSLRAALPVLIAALALFVVLVPLSTTVVNDISVFNVNYTHEQLKYQLYAQDLAPLVNFSCIVFGAVLAIVEFRFLLVKRATTAFFSVGLSRMKLFASRYAVGLLGVLVGIGIPFALSLLLNYLALGFYEGQIYEFFYVLSGYLTTALIAFALASIAVICAGTLFETCVFSVALLSGVSVLLWGIGVLADALLVGSASGATLYGQDIAVEPSLLDRFSWMNPLLFFSESGGDHQFFMALHPVYYPELGSYTLIAGWLVVFVLLAAAACALLCVRRGEQAEMAGKAPAFSLFSVAVFGFAAFGASVALLGAVDVLVSLVIGFALFLLVSLALLFGPLRGRTSSNVTLTCVGSELAAMLVAVVVVATGAFGFAGYVPETQDVESVEVSYNGSPSYLTQGFSGVASGSSYYYTSYRCYSQESSIDIVRSLHAQLIESARGERVTVYTDFQSTIVPYDVVIRYHMKNGETLVRYYDQATIGELTAMLSLDNDQHTHDLENAVITGDTSGLSDDELKALSDSPSYNAYRAGALYAADGALNRIMKIDCTDEERSELLEALADDLAGMSASERYQPSKPARAVLMFTLSPELDVASFGYSFSNAVSYVTDDWTATMEWLESHGYMEALGNDLDPLTIERLTFQLDDPYASINKVTTPVSRFFMAYRTEVSGSYWVTQDYGALKVVEEQEKIAQVLPNLRMGCSMDGGYLVEAKLRGIEAYVYFYLPTDLAPDFL